MLNDAILVVSKLVWNPSWFRLTTGIIWAQVRKFEHFGACFCTCALIIWSVLLHHAPSSPLRWLDACLPMRDCLKSWRFGRGRSTPASLARPLAGSSRSVRSWGTASWTCIAPCLVAQRPSSMWWHARHPDEDEDVLEAAPGLTWAQAPAELAAPF
jgi:hypothetical protein